MTTPRPSMRELAATREEMYRQNERWGEQNHPDMPPGPNLNTYASAARYWKRVNDTAAQNGNPTWDGILQEEVFEALEQAELGNEVNLRTELIQVAAVALQWAGAIRRRQS